MILNPNNFHKPHNWLVYLTKDNRLRAALIKTKKDLEYYKARQDITTSTTITAFTRTEAWHKGKAFFEKK